MLLRVEVAAFHPPRCTGSSVQLAPPAGRAMRRLVSVALFLALGTYSRTRLLRPAVSRHPALWSPDFPLV